MASDTASKFHTRRAVTHTSATGLFWSAVLELLALILDGRGDAESKQITYIVCS